MERFPYLIPHFPCRKYAGKQQEKKPVGRLPAGTAVPANWRRMK